LKEALFKKLNEKNAHNFTTEEIDKIYKSNCEEKALKIKNERIKRKNKKFLNIDASIDDEKKKDDKLEGHNEWATGRLMQMKAHRAELQNISDKIEKLKTLLEYQIK